MLDLRFSAGSRTSSLNVVHGDEAEIAFTPTVGSRFFDVSSNFCLSRCPFSGDGAKEVSAKMGWLIVDRCGNLASICALHLVMFFLPCNLYELRPM